MRNAIGILMVLIAFTACANPKKAKVLTETNKKMEQVTFTKIWLVKSP